MISIIITYIMHTQQVYYLIICLPWQYNKTLPLLVSDYKE